MRAHIVGVAALTGVVIAVGAQRRQAHDPRPDTIDQDVSRTTRIAPDGRRINGSWIAANFDDQEMVDLAQSVHSVIVADRHLPPIARHLLSQRCLELQASLETRRSRQEGLELQRISLVCEQLTWLRTSLEKSKADSKPPLEAIDRDALAKLIESVIYPICVWDQRRLQELFVDSDRNLRNPIL